MQHRTSTFFSGRLRAVAAAVLFALIALVAAAGAVLLAAQERSRLRVVSEYRAFQLVTDLLRAFDSGDPSAISQVEGLRAFAVYSRRGEILFRFGEAPATVSPQESTENARFEGGIVSFVRLVGGNPSDGQHARRLGMMPMGAGSGMGMGNARLVFIAYDTAALRTGERLVFLIAAFVVASIVVAFFLLFSLVRSLDEYRDREVRNRELLALGEAARTLTHEIKNPLGVVKIQCALLRKTTGESARDGLRIIEEETDRLALLASRVKAFLGADEGMPSPVAVADAVASYASRYGDRLSTHCDPSASAAHVFIDPLRLDQILDNLIANAMESMDGQEFMPPHLSAESVHGRVVFALADSGKGISEKEKARVFDLFYTTKTTGAGIGLALAKRYAEAAGGKISHHPRQGGGTVFELDLPEHKGNNR